MEKNEDSQDQEQVASQSENEADTSELGEEELDETSGGIIIVSGKPVLGQTRASSIFEKVSLNPQPLPPKTFKTGGQ